MSNAAAVLAARQAEARVVGAEARYAVRTARSIHPHVVFPADNP